MLVATNNGATYYFRVFAKRYYKEKMDIAQQLTLVPELTGLQVAQDEKNKITVSADVEQCLQSAPLVPAAGAYSAGAERNNT